MNTRIQIYKIEIRRPESAWLVDILCRIQTVSMDPNPSPKSKSKSEIQNPKSKTQNPKSKIQNPTGPFGAATKRTKTKPIQNPKSKIRNPKSKIQNPKSKIQNPKSEIQNPNSKLQTPKSKLQNPKSKRPVWSLDFDFGFGRARAGGDGHVANEDVWPCWPPELGLVGGTQACNRKVAGSIPPTRGPNWAPISGGEVLPKSGLDFRPRVAEIGAEFPEKLRARRRCWKCWVNIAQEKKDPSLQIYLYWNVNIIYKSSSTLSTIPGPMQQISRVGGWQALACLNKFNTKI